MNADTNPAVQAALNATYDFSRQRPRRSGNHGGGEHNFTHRRNHDSQDYQPRRRRRDQNNERFHWRHRVSPSSPCRKVKNRRYRSRHSQLSHRRSNRPTSGPSSDSLHPQPMYRTELDSHADNCVAGANTVLVKTDGRTTTVTDFKGTKCDNIPIGTVATYWESPNGTPYILIIHEALYFGDKFDVTLLTPNQMRHNGLVVEDVPRQFDADSTHSIYDPVSRIRIPLSLNGVFSGFTSYKPTKAEFHTLPRIYLTSDGHWHPYSDDLARAERSHLDSIERDLASPKGVSPQPTEMREHEGLVSLDHNANPDCENRGLPDSDKDDEDYHINNFDNLELEGPSHITVQGAGNPTVNGVYSQDGYFENALRYAMDGVWNHTHHKISIFMCNVSNSTKHWYISVVPAGRTPGTTADVDFYTAPISEHSATLPPKSGWIKTGEGLDPPPTISFREQPSI
jgi:hypothetical protein